MAARGHQFRPAGSPAARRRACDARLWRARRRTTAHASRCGRRRPLGACNWPRARLRRHRPRRWEAPDTTPSISLRISAYSAISGCAHRQRLDDVVAAFEGMHREAADIVQAPAGMSVKLAVPGKARPFGIERVAVAQRIELQVQVFTQHGLRVGEDRTGGDRCRLTVRAHRMSQQPRERGTISLRRLFAVAEPLVERLEQLLGGFRDHRAGREDRLGSRPASSAS